MLNTLAIELVYTRKEDIIKKLITLRDEMDNIVNFMELDNERKLDHLHRKHKLVFLIDYMRNISKDTDIQLKLSYKPLLMKGTYKKELFLKGELPKMSERKYSSDYEDYTKKQKELLEKFFEKLFGAGVVEIDGYLIDSDTFEQFPTDQEFLDFIEKYVDYSRIAKYYFCDSFYEQLREEIQEGIAEEYEGVNFSETILEVYESEYFRNELKKAVDMFTEELKKELTEKREQGIVTETYVDSGEMLYTTEHMLIADGLHVKK